MELLRYTKSFRCNPLDDDDFIFEDFARTRMKGGENAEDHPSPSNHDNSLI